MAARRRSMRGEARARLLLRSTFLPSARHVTTLHVKPYYTRRPRKTTKDKEKEEKEGFWSRSLRFDSRGYVIPLYNTIEEGGGDRSRLFPPSPPSTVSSPDFPPRRSRPVESRPIQTRGTASSWQGSASSGQLGVGRERMRHMYIITTGQSGIESGAQVCRSVEAPGSGSSRWFPRVRA